MAQQRQQSMADLAGLAAIVQTTGQIREQANPTLRQIQQADTAVRGDIATRKITIARKRSSVTPNLAMPAAAGRFGKQATPKIT